MSEDNTYPDLTSSCMAIAGSFKSLSISKKSSFKRLFRKSKSILILDPLDETRPGRPLPNLPPELWVIIIRISAGSFDYGHESIHDEDRYFSVPSTSVPLLTREEYLSSISQKLSCSLVSKRWNAYTSEVLYEYIWLSKARQAKALALTLLCQVCASPIVDPTIYSTSSMTSSLSPFSAPHYTHYPTPSNSRRTTPLAASKSNQSGRHIRVLHLETPTLDRCDPVDIRVILDYAPNLLAFCDFKSIRRNILEEVREPRGSTEGLLMALGQSGEVLVKRLAWTCYSSDYIRMSAVTINSIVQHIEYLEVDFSVCGTGSGIWGIGDEEVVFTTGGVPTTQVEQSTEETISFLGGMVRSRSTTTVDSKVHGEMGEMLANGRGPKVIAGVEFPALKGLKVTLPDSSFDMLASWDMPQLRDLTVAIVPTSTPAPHGSRTGKTMPFHRFFQKHGEKLIRLELCSALTPETIAKDSEDLRLAKLCPNLKSFVCSCSASEEVEWDWENPDWVAPHALLTSHENLEFIGIRGLGDVVKRAWEDAAPQATSPLHSAYLYSADASPFFMLVEQITSLLRKEKFPNLKFIRDMSEGSDALRRGTTAVVCPVPAVSSYSNTSRLRRVGSRWLGLSPASSPSLPYEEVYDPRLGVPGHARIVSFWKEILNRTWEGGVYVEDHRGVNVTRRDLERWGRGVTVEV